MVKVTISGYSVNEGTRTFEILDREEIEEIIDNLDFIEIYEQTYDKASGYSASGCAYTYVDARDGKVVTRWQQDGQYDHPWDSFYEVVVCTIDTPIFEFRDEDLIGEYEYNKYRKLLDAGEISSPEDFIEKTMGEEELIFRTNEAIRWYASEYEPDWEYINFQLHRLYKKSLK